MQGLEPLPEEATVELRHARARARNADLVASSLEAKAREARARATAARIHYDNLLLELGGQLSLIDELDDLKE